MASEFFSGLSQNFSQLLEDADDYNIIIKVGENSNTKEFNAHSNILRARSPYFKRALSQNWVTKKNNMINFAKPNISPTVFEMIISYYWANTTESFIFSLGDGKDLKNYKISRVKNSSYAMYESHYQNTALNFGNSDLVINNNVGTCNQSQYASNILDLNSFTIEEMEIFRFY
ncbi:3513_t:CDS:2 [Funneliformis mosseae]|uniref:3513_t:CDS:1 n=1 Tax=Funneliformis mosseae TaxID=27381 RepID=A0A9N9AL86_FUNMO|nr:3513_t:CDS:2 [Funneliformis mosseae]